MPLWNWTSYPAWRLVTKGISAIFALRHVVIKGDRELGEAFLALVAILD